MQAITTIATPGETAALCHSVGVSRATLYRHRRPAPPPRPQAPSPRAPSPRALGPTERQAVLDVLHSPRFVDQSPTEVHATLLEEQTYLCSPRTMYRVLAAAHEVRERRAHNMRRDAEGIPYQRAAQSQEPSPTCAQAAFAHLLLLRANPVRRAAWYELGGQSVRVVNGGGQMLSTVRERYVEPPAAVQADVVVCAGATDLGVPGHLVSRGFGASTVRPAPGGTSKWVTLEAAKDEWHL